MSTESQTPPADELLKSVTPDHAQKVQQMLKARPASPLAAHGKKR